MKTINPALLNQLNSPVSTLTHCALITRADGVKIGFTDHIDGFWIDGVYYTPQIGSDTSALESSSRLSVDNLSITGILSSDAITKDDLLKGRYDRAVLDIFLIDYTNPPDEVVPGKVIMLKTFVFGEVTIRDDVFVVECRSLVDLLSTVIGETTSAICRAKFGDARCKKDLAAYTHSVTVTGASGRSVTLSAAFPDGYLTHGRATFHTGANAGVTVDIARQVGSTIHLHAPTPYAVAAGDQVTVVAGCDKTLSACASFGNVVNFRGEPHVPGADKWKSGYIESV